MAYGPMMWPQYRDVNLPGHLSLQDLGALDNDKWT